MPGLGAPVHREFAPKGFLALLDGKPVGFVHLPYHR
jgi:hypothetical protein